MNLLLKYKCVCFLSGLLLVTLSCSDKKTSVLEQQKDVKAILVTAKYCNRFSPKYETDGINIYFAGGIKNNTEDTIYIPNKDLGFADQYSHPLEESLFYSIIDGDSLFFMSFYPNIRIRPAGYATVNLQRHITPDETKWMSIFKDIDKNQEILDTMKICYASPNLKLDKIGKILLPIEFERSSKFRIDTAAYNSYFEHIFKMREYYENPPKEYLED